MTDSLAAVRCAGGVWRPVAALALLLAVTVCPAEQPIETALAGGARPGEAQWLEAGNQRFLALLRIQNTPDPVGGVILLPDVGEHADWPAVIRPLRVGLARHGWQTLALQLAGGADAPRDVAARRADSVARLAAAEAFLAARKVGPMVVIGHGFGATVATAFLAASSAMVGAVLISPTDTSERFAKVRVPALEIYGELERKAVLDAVRAHRRIRRRAPVAEYRALALPGVGHDLGGVESGLLVRRVRGWLEHLRTTIKPASGAAPS